MWGSISVGAGEGLFAAAAPFLAVKYWWRQRGWRKVNCHGWNTGGSVGGDEKSIDGALGIGNGGNYKVLIVMDMRTWWACEGHMWRCVLCDVPCLVVGQPTASARRLSRMVGADGVLRRWNISIESVLPSCERARDKYDNNLMIIETSSQRW